MLYCTNNMLPQRMLALVIVDIEMWLQDCSSLSFVIILFQITLNHMFIGSVGNKIKTNTKKT